MKKHNLVILFAALAIVCSIAQAASGFVPIELEKKAAMQKAEQEWGQVAVGPYETYYDLNEEPIAYAFVFKMNSTGAFEEKEILQQVSSGNDYIQRCITVKSYDEMDKAVKQRNGTDIFGTIIVSARYEISPIIMYRHSLPVRYILYNDAIKKAKSILKTSAIKYARTIFYDPFDFWLEFTAGGKTTYITPEMRAFEPDSIFIGKYNYEKSPNAEAKWQQIENARYDSKGIISYNDIAGVPSFPWVYGCSPTASGMILAYWDNYGYDRLVDYYGDWTNSVTGETYNNVAALPGFLWAKNRI